MFGKINQRGNLENKKGEQSFLCMTYHCDLIPILIKLHEDILMVTELCRIQEFWKN